MLDRIEERRLIAEAAERIEQAQTPAAEYTDPAVAKAVVIWREFTEAVKKARGELEAAIAARRDRVSRRDRRIISEAKARYPDLILLETDGELLPARCMVSGLALFEGDEIIAESVSVVAAATASAAAAVVTEQTARISADSALATSLSTLTATVTTNAATAAAVVTTTPLLTSPSLVLWRVSVTLLESGSRGTAPWPSRSSGTKAAPKPRRAVIPSRPTGTLLTATASGRARASTTMYV